MKVTVHFYEAEQLDKMLQDRDKPFCVFVKTPQMINSGWKFFKHEKEAIEFKKFLEEQLEIGK